MNRGERPGAPSVSSKLRSIDSDLDGERSKLQGDEVDAGNLPHEAMKNSVIISLEIATRRLLLFLCWIWDSSLLLGLLPLQAISDVVSLPEVQATTFHHTLQDYLYRSRPSSSKTYVCMCIVLSYGIK